MRDRLTWSRLFSRSRQHKDRRTRKRITPQPGTTILVVDDSRTITHLMKKMLQQSGYETLEAKDAESGIELAKQHRPALIFMDVVLPGMNGFQATRVLSKEPDTAEIPIVVMSGNQQATERFWVRRIGARDFMTKPFERGTVFEKLESALPSSAVA